MIVRSLRNPFSWLLFLPAMAIGQQPTHRIESTDVQNIHATLGYDARTREFTVTRWYAYLPEPPELPSQTKVKITTEPNTRIITEKSLLSRKIRLFDVTVAKPESGSKLLMREEIRATLRSRKLIPLNADEKPPVVPALGANERKFYLSPSKRVDFEKSEFKDWLAAKKLQRGKRESPMDYAARVLTVIRNDYAYRFDPTEEKFASTSCTRTATDCGGMSFIFVGALRANEIPARALIGRFAKPRKPGTTPLNTEYDQPHVRTEFYVAGLGWVPVDPTLVNRETDRPVNDYIGFDPGDMLVLHVDLDLRIPAPDKDQTVDQLQVEPYVWTTGHGKLDLFLAGSRWDVKTTPLEK